MSFYENALKEGYSDDQIAEYLAKKHSYPIEEARKEGHSSKDLIEYLSSKKENVYQRLTPEPVKNFVGGAEAGARMFWNVPAGAIAQGWGSIAGGLMGEGVEGALQRGTEAAERVHIPAATKQGELADEALSVAYEKLYRETAGDIGAEDLKYNPNAPKGSIRSDPKSEAKARSFGEFGADVLAFSGLIRQGLKIPKQIEAKKEAARVEAERRVAEEKTKTETEEPRQYIKYKEEFSQGSGEAAQAAIDRQVPRSPYTPGQTPPQLDRMNRASEVLPEDPNRPFYGDPRVGLTRELPEQRYNLSRTQINEQPITRQEQQAIKQRPTEFDRPERTFSPDGFPPSGFSEGRPAGPVGRTWQIADPTVVEALSRDSIRKGMETKVAFQEKILSGLVERQSQLFQERGDRAVKGQMTSTVDRLLRDNEVARNRVETNISKLQTSIDNRISKTTEKARNTPTYNKTSTPDRILADNEVLRKQGTSNSSLYEKTFDPYQKVGYTKVDTTRPRGPKGQRGMVNTRILAAMATLGTSELAIAGYSAVKKIRGGMSLRASVEKTPYIYGENNLVPTLKIELLDQSGRPRGQADFVLDETQQNLYSKWTDVGLGEHGPMKGLQGKFLSSELYKFASELGNTIKPDKEQTSEGSGMWDKLRKKGIALETPAGNKFIPPSKERGMATPDFLTAGLSRLFKGAKPPQEPGPTKNKASVLEAATGENRPWTEFWKKEGPDMPDLPGDPFTKGIQYASNAQVLYHNTQHQGVKYIADFVANEKAQSTLRTDVSTEGINLGGKGLILPKKVIDPSSPHAVFNGLSPKEKATAMEIINKFSAEVEPTVDQMRAMGASKKVMDALETLQKPLRDFLKEVNTELVALGKNPIKERPFYFMKSVGTGNFLIRLKERTGFDKDGKPILESVAFQRAHTKIGADILAKELQEKFGKNIEGLTIEVEKADSRSQGNKFNVNPSILEDIYQALEKDDPRRAAISSAAQEIASKGGKFGHHKAFRKGVEGMELDSKNFWKTYEGYLKDGHNYISNLHLSNLMKQIELTSDIPPRFKNWAIDYLNRSRGGGEPKEVFKALENGLDNILGSRAVLGGFAPGTARNILNFGNKLFTSQALFFGNIPFLTAQSLQSTAFAPAMLAHYKYNQGYSKGSVIKSLVAGPMNMFVRNPEFQRVVDFLSNRGKIDPTLIQEFSMFGEGRKSWEKNLDRYAQWSFIPRKLEGLNRVHAASMAYDFLKDNGYKGKSLNIEVERMVDDIMGNYSYSDRPGLVTRNGIIGQGVAPLLTFKNWFLGMTTIMAKEAGKGMLTGNWSKAVPFIGLFLPFLVLGGVTGMLGLKEMDAAWNWFHRNFNPNEKVPSLIEEILTSDLPDAGKFGIVTGATQMIDPRGVHIGGGMASPEFMPSVATHGFSNFAPGFTKLGNVGEATLMGALEVLDLKTLTVAERKNLAKGIMPGTWGKLMDNLDSTFLIKDLMETKFGFDGRPVPGGPRGYGTVDRKDNWEIGASILGAGTIPEYTKKMVNRDIEGQKLSISERRTALVDKSVDALMQGQSIEELSRQAGKLEFHDYASAVYTAYMNRMKTESERAVGSGTTPAQGQRHQYIKEATQ